MKKSILAIVVLLSFVLPVFPKFENYGTKFRENNKENIELVSDDRRRFIIPVVFHVLYNNADENVSSERLMEVLEALQNDFMGTNSDISTVPDEFKDDIGIPNIKFVLADIPGDSRVKNGIIRQPTDEGTFNFKRNKMFTESPIIEPSKYLNVYICDINTGGYYPNSSKAKFDGIVVDYENAVKGGRTITHETGHWLDLYHIFRSDKGCGNDWVEDTPKQKKHSMKSNQLFPLAECGSKSVMFMNFMDYNEVRTFFTVGQVKRMRDYLIKNKPLLQFE